MHMYLNLEVSSINVVVGLGTQTVNRAQYAVNLVIIFHLTSKSREEERDCACACFMFVFVLVRLVCRFSVGVFRMRCTCITPAAE